MNRDRVDITIQLNGHDLPSLGDLPATILDSVQIMYGSELSLLPHSTKASIVRQLDSLGFLSMRNAVKLLAKRFDVTPKCIYQWLGRNRQAN